MVYLRKIKVINLRNRKNYKIIEVPNNLTLYKFAEIIVNAFGFDFDHCFGFYDNLKDIYKSKVMYELFTDLPDVENTPGAHGVQKFFFVSDLFETQDNFLFLFDYGDNWEFELVTLEKLEKANKVPKNYYKIIESHGTDPIQYPEEDDYEFEEDD